jgi:hypothetical protein
MSSYAEYWQRFLCFCYRIIGEEDKYGVEFLDEQKARLWDLKTSLELANMNDKTMDEKVFHLLNITN